VLLRALRQQGLANTALASAQCDTIRVKLLKVGATIMVSVRRVYVALATGYPFQEVFRRVWEQVRAVQLPSTPAVVETG
jgi:hypothetical protein